MTDAPAQSHLRLRCSTCVLPDGLATAQVSDRLRRSDPPPHAHARTPPHHCAYAPRHIVHCTPLAHAADRWRSVCTITDAPAQSRLKLRRSHVHYVPSLARTLRSPCHAPVCATVRAPWKLTFTLRLSRTVVVLFARGWRTSYANIPIAYAAHRWSLMCIRWRRGGCSSCGWLGATCATCTVCATWAILTKNVKSI